MHILKIGLGQDVPAPSTIHDWQFVQAGDALSTQLAAVVGAPCEDDAVPSFAAGSDWSEVTKAAADYEKAQIPAFLHDLINFADNQPTSFATPGHHGGQAFKSAPAGQALLDFFGQNLFSADVSDSVDALGDMMTHGGSPLAAEKAAAKVYGVDEVYFVTNGTTSANAICAAAALAPGDLVLFDRNNHKSLDNGALVLTGAKPVYLPTNRNALGMIGGPAASSMDEAVLRKAAAEVDPAAAQKARPFRLAVLQLDTYDGQFSQLHYVLDHLGKLCDYILFDDAWGGFEHFVSALAASDVAQLQLTADDPGILITQSLHKTMTALSQGSQILKRDSHLQGQARYIDHNRFNHAYLKFVTTSYSYPLYAALTVNAYVQGQGRGQKQWQNALDDANTFRKALYQTKLFRPFVAETVNDKPWQDNDLAALRQADAWQVAPKASWHGFKDVAADQYTSDPLKVTITYGTMADPLPAPIVGAYLAGQGIIAEKNDLNSGLFLATPGSTSADWQKLLKALKQLEQLYFEGADATAALGFDYPGYAGTTLHELAYQMQIDMEDLELTDSLQQLFFKDQWGETEMTPAEADHKFVRGNGQWVPLKEAVGKVALEGALPYPPGIFVVMPGEKWTALAQQYFLNLAEFMQLYPGFGFEIQGVYFDQKQPRVYVAK